MVYRNFNVHTWTFVCASIIHMGVGHTDSKSAQPFDLEKQVFLVLLTGFEPSIFGSPGQRVTPIIQIPFLKLCGLSMSVTASSVNGVNFPEEIKL